MTQPQISGAFRVGLVQMCSGRDVAKNVAAASELIRESAAGGAQYVQTPEMTTLIELERDRIFAAAEPEESSTALASFTDLARELTVWLHIGSMPILLAGRDKLVNRSFLIAPDGQVGARYDKIHMFDVDLGDGETYTESANYEPGRHAVLADLPWGTLGFSICYDLRFPVLYRALARAGASFLAIPAAFTRSTGMAHWHSLVRARAIESQAFVFAATQGGTHENGRQTFGHSMVVTPWGEILCEASDHPVVVFADIDLQRLADARARVPSLQHDRLFDVVHAGTQTLSEARS